MWTAVGNAFKDPLGAVDPSTMMNPFEDLYDSESESFYGYVGANDTLLATRRSEGPLRDDDVVWAKLPGHEWWPAVATTLDEKDGGLQKGDEFYVRFCGLDMEGPTIKYYHSQVRAFQGVHQSSTPPDGMYSKKHSMQAFSAAFDEAVKMDPSRWWAGEPAVLQPPVPKAQSPLPSRARRRPTHSSCTKGRRVSAQTGSSTKLPRMACPAAKPCGAC
eukprot:7384470-Prymnesium_polylepis.1